MGIYRLAPLVDVFGTVLADVEIWADGDVVGGVAVSRAALENLKMKNMRDLQSPFTSISKTFI